MLVNIFKVVFKPVSVFLLAIIIGMNCPDIISMYFPGYKSAYEIVAPIAVVGVFILASLDNIAKAIRESKGQSQDAE